MDQVFRFLDKKYVDIAGSNFLRRLKMIFLWCFFLEKVVIFLITVFRSKIAYYDFSRETIQENVLSNVWKYLDPNISTYFLPRNLNIRSNFRIGLNKLKINYSANFRTVVAPKYCPVQKIEQYPWWNDLGVVCNNTSPNSWGIVCQRLHVVF